MLTTCVLIVLEGCASAEPTLPEDIRARAGQAPLESAAVDECLQFSPNSEQSSLESAWGGTLSEAIDLAEAFDHRNTASREVLSQVDAGTYVALCVFSGSQWESLTPGRDRAVLAYAANHAALRDLPGSSTIVSGIIGYL